MFIIFTRVNKKPGREGHQLHLARAWNAGFRSDWHLSHARRPKSARNSVQQLRTAMENLVIREDGFRKLLTAFNTQRCLNPSISLGLAEGAFAEALKYALEREIFGKAIGDFQGNRWKLAEMYREIETARSVHYRACMTANPFPDPFMAAVASFAPINCANASLPGPISFPSIKNTMVALNTCHI